MHTSVIPKAATGIAGLDAVLHGGLPAGRTTLLSGGLGTGKTVIALEQLYRAAELGEPGLLVSFEEGTGALRANGATLGLDLAGLESAGRLEILHVAPPVADARSGDFGIQGLLGVLAARADAIGARRTVLDGIDQLMRVFPDPERARDELSCLHAWLLERALTSVITLKVESNGEAVFPFLGFLADCVLLLDQRMDHQVRTRRLQVVKYRGSGFLSNEYPYVITPNGVVVMPVSGASLKWSSDGGIISSGDLVLDEVLGGGFRRGSSVLVAGPAGIGKTTVASLLARSACRAGEPTLYVSFEEPVSGLVAGMRSVGIDLGAELEGGRLRCLSSMPEGLGLEEHLISILAAADEHRARHLVVDSVNAIGRMGSERATADFMVRLIAETGRRGVTCLLTSQSGIDPMADCHRGLAITSLMDTVLLLRYVEGGDAMRRRLLVLKSRGFAHSTRFHWYELGDDGVTLGLPGMGSGDLTLGGPP